MSRGIFWGAVVAGGLALAVMVIVTLMWMIVPQRIVNQESSLQRTDVYSIEVTEHGQSHFLTPDQKRTLDWVRTTTPLVWFGGFGTAFLATIVGAAAWLKMNKNGT